MKIKWMWNGIKIDGKLYRAFYSKDNRVDQAKGITVYRRDYLHFPKIKGLNIENNSDIMTDYFEKDRIWIPIESPFYLVAYEAWKKAQIKANDRMQKRALKYNFTFNPMAVA